MPEAPRLGPVLKELAGAIANTSLFFDELDKTNVPLLLRAFKQLRDAKEVLDELHKSLNEIERKLSRETVPEALEAMDPEFDPEKPPSMRIGGFNYSISSRRYVSIPVIKKEAAFEWLKENKYEGLIKEQVNAQALSSAMSGYTEETGKDPPPELFNSFTEKYITVRKA